MRSHEIERIYMSQLRNLESAIYALERKQRKYEQEIEYLNEPILDPKEEEKPLFDKKDVFWKAGGALMTGMGGGVLALLILGGVSLLIKVVGGFLFRSSWLYKVMVWIWDNILSIGIVLALLLFVFILSRGIIGSIKKYRNDVRTYFEKQERNRRICKKNIGKREQRVELLKTRIQQKNRIDGELRKGQMLRDRLYSYDWIPARYRDIRVVYYLSDIVTTSAITIEEALKYYLLQEVNNKLDEVLRRLDEMVRNQNQMFVRQAILEAQNEKNIQQNEAMIQKMAQIETNTESASQYAKLAADYSEANAYFCWASYLMDGK